MMFSMRHVDIFFTSDAWYNDLKDQKLVHNSEKKQQRTNIHKIDFNFTNNDSIIEDPISLQNKVE